MTTKKIHFFAAIVGLPLFASGCASGNAEKLAVATGDASIIYASELKKLQGVLGETSKRRANATAQLQGVTARSRARLDTDIKLHGGYGRSGARDVKAYNNFRTLATQLAKAEEDVARVRGDAETQIISNLDLLPKQDVAIRKFGADLLILGKPRSTSQSAGQLISLVKTVVDGVAAARKDGKEGGTKAAEMAESATKKAVEDTSAADKKATGAAGS